MLMDEEVSELMDGDVFSLERKRFVRLYKSGFLIRKGVFFVGI